MKTIMMVASKRSNLRHKSIAALLYYIELIKATKSPQISLFSSMLALIPQSENSSLYLEGVQTEPLDMVYLSANAWIREVN